MQLNSIAFSAMEVALVIRVAFNTVACKICTLKENFHEKFASAWGGGGGISRFSAFKGFENNILDRYT